MYMNQTLFLKKVVSIKTWWPLVYSSPCNIQANLPTPQKMLNYPSCFQGTIYQLLSASPRWSLRRYQQSVHFNSPMVSIWLVERRQDESTRSIERIFNLVTTGFEAFPLMKSLDEWTGRLSEEVGLALHKETYSSVFIEPLWWQVLQAE